MDFGDSDHAIFTVHLLQGKFYDELASCEVYWQFVYYYSVSSNFYFTCLCFMHQRHNFFDSNFSISLLMHCMNLLCIEQ